MPEKQDKFVNCRDCWIKHNTSAAYQAQNCPGCKHVAAGGRPTPSDPNYMDHFHRTYLDGPASKKREL